MNATEQALSLLCQLSGMLHQHTRVQTAFSRPIRSAMNSAMYEDPEAVALLCRSVHAIESFSDLGRLVGRYAIAIAEKDAELIKIMSEWYESKLNEILENMLARELEQCSHGAWDIGNFLRMFLEIRNLALQGCEAGPT
jgi:hypothetical protein